jgi:hypothetical protein
MKEYCFIKDSNRHSFPVNECRNQLNAHAKQGWVLCGAVQLIHEVGETYPFTTFATLEREKQS